jgi:hypothetical protein
VAEGWSIGGAPAVGLERRVHASPEDVFERDYDRLVQALTVIAGSRDAAADAVQEAFVRLINRWDKVAAYEDPAGWVRRVAINLIRDQQRAFLRQAKLVLRLERHQPAREGALQIPEAWPALVGRGSRSLPTEPSTRGRRAECSGGSHDRVRLRPRPPRRAARPRSAGGRRRSSLASCEHGVRESDIDTTARP